MSMPVQLTSSHDGTKQFVDKEHRAYTFATVESEELHQTNEGRSWNINTGDIDLTQTTATLYVRNTGTVDLVVHTMVGIASYSAGATGATDNILFQVIRNPTTGTLISGATALNVYNRNFGSAKPISATVYVGADGETITDGDVIVQSRHNPASRLALSIPLIMPQGASIGVRITEPTGNTNMNYQTALIVSERDAIGPND